jgi:hypothetical protein
VIVRFVGVEEIVDYHCLNFLFIMVYKDHYDIFYSGKYPLCR